MENCFYAYISEIIPSSFMRSNFSTYKKTINGRGSLNDHILVVVFYITFLIGWGKMKTGATYLLFYIQLFCIIFQLTILWR